MVKYILRSITPPVIYQGAARLLKGSVRHEPEWRVAGEWVETAEPWGNYARNKARVEQRQSLAETQSGLCYFLTAAYAVTRAAEGKSSLSVVDFGGALGAYADVIRNALAGKVVDYTVVDLPAVCDEGRRVRPDIRFVSTLPSTPTDFVLASGVLHYCKDWRGQLQELAAIARPWLLVSRLPVLFDLPSTMALQQIAGAGPASLWFLNRDEFFSTSRNLGLSLVQEISQGDDFSPVAGLASTPHTRAYFFRS